MSGVATQAPCEPNAGIAGTGVVVSFIVSAILAVVAPPFFSHREKWEGMVVGFGMNQFMAGWAISVAGFVAYPDSLLDAHALLAVALGLLGCSSHTIPFWFCAKEERTASSRLRLVFCFAQSLFLVVVTMIRRKPDGPSSYDHSEKQLDAHTTRVVVLAFLQGFGDFCFFCMAFVKETFRKNTLLRALVLVAALIYTGVVISVVAKLKWVQTECSMNTGEDNEWTFGQYLAVLMLAAPLLSSLEILLDIWWNMEGKVEARELQEQIELAERTRREDKQRNS